MILVVIILSRYLFSVQESSFYQNTHANTCCRRRPVQVETKDERDAHMHGIISGIYAQTKHIGVYAHSQWPSDTHLAIFLIHPWVLFSPCEVYLSVFLSHSHAIILPPCLHGLLRPLPFSPSAFFLIMQLFHFIHLLFFIININELVRYKIGGFFLSNEIRCLIKTITFRAIGLLFLFVSFSHSIWMWFLLIFVSL